MFENCTDICNYFQVQSTKAISLSTTLPLIYVLQGRSAGIFNTLRCATSKSLMPTAGQQDIFCVRITKKKGKEKR